MEVGAVQHEFHVLRVLRVLRVRTLMLEVRMMAYVADVEVE